MNKNELRAVVEKAQNGEKTAFEKLYKEFHEKLYFFVLKNVEERKPPSGSVRIVPVKVLSTVRHRE